MKVLRGCLIALALYLLLAFSIAAVVERRVGTREPAIPAGLIGGAIASLGLMHLGRAGAKLRELLLIRRGLAGVEPQDGQRFAAIGPITPMGGKRLTSPLTQTPAVAYSYDIMLGGRKWEGKALTPSAIRCGVNTVRLRAFPHLDFPKERLAAARQAQEYLRQTRFTPPVGRNVKETVDALFAVYEDGDGSVREDRGYGDPPQSLGGALMVEQVVRPGETVCAIGLYSASQNALVVDPRVRLHSVHLEKGTPGQLIGRRVSAIGGSLMNATVMLALVAAALAALYTVVPMDFSDEVAASKPSWTEIRLEEMIEDRLRQPLVRAGMPLAQAEIGAALSAGEARGRVRTAQRETSVIQASAASIADVIAVSLQDDSGAAAVALTVHLSGALRSLRIAGHEIDVASIPPGRFAFRRISDEEIAGRLSWAAKGAEECRITFRTRIDGT